MNFDNHQCTKYLTKLYHTSMYYIITTAVLTEKVSNLNILLSVVNYNVLLILTLIGEENFVVF